MENEDIINRVKEFIACASGLPLEKVRLDTKLCWDLGLEGDYAIIFFDEFASRFEIDRDSLSAIDFQKHFGPQPLGCGGWIGILIFSTIVSLWYNLGEEWGLSCCGSALFATIGTYFVFSLIGYFLEHFRNDSLFNQEEITVRDLVDAAQAKRWVAMT
jgi:hypothetical protein